MPVNDRVTQEAIIVEYINTAQVVTAESLMLEYQQGGQYTTAIAIIVEYVVGTMILGQRVQMMG